MTERIEQGSHQDQSGDPLPPRLDGEYTQIEIAEPNRPNTFDTKFGTLALHTLDVSVERTYSDESTRTTGYEVLTVYRTDNDAPDQSAYPLVHYSNALLTTARTPGTATNRYFLNPALEGFASVNVSVKKRITKNCLERLKHLIPHTLSLEEMADDELVATKHVAATLGLGMQPDVNGITHINKSGYSRGTQLSLVEVARAGLHDMTVDRLHGRGPGPINKANALGVGKSILKEMGAEGKEIGKQLFHDPAHAAHNYLNVVTHRPEEILSYAGDAGALLGGDVARAMPFIHPDLRGYVSIFDRDPFGRHKDYIVHFQDIVDGATPNTNVSHTAPGLRLILHPGAHMSGMDSRHVKFDRLEWKMERELLDREHNAPSSFAS